MYGNIILHNYVLWKIKWCILSTKQAHWPNKKMLECSMLPRYHVSWYTKIIQSYAFINPWKLHWFQKRRFQLQLQEIIVFHLVIQLSQHKQHYISLDSIKNKGRTILDEKLTNCKWKAPILHPFFVLINLTLIERLYSFTIWYPLRIHSLR